MPLFKLAYVLAQHGLNLILPLLPRTPTPIPRECIPVPRSTFCRLPEKMMGLQENPPRQHVPQLPSAEMVKPLGDISRS